MFISSIQERLEVLEDLFCTIGNGYYWENGELTSDEKRRKITKKEFEEEKLIYLKEKDYKIRKNLPIFSFYPLYNNHSNLLNIPKNIKPDWLNAAIEITEFILNNSKEDDEVYKEFSKEELKKHLMNLNELKKDLN